MGSTEVIDTLTGRSFEENLAFIVKDSQEEFLYHILIGFVPNMRVSLKFDDALLFNDFMLYRYLVVFS